MSDRQDEFAFAKPEAPPPPPPPPPAPADVHPVEGPFKQLMSENFIQYASYVIRDRAIPDLDDGLKPVQRRILFSLHENDDGKFIKVANIVGYCMQFHPHGDASIGDALVTLANKQYLIEGQGNFGNLMTGDPAAASRYIECRLTALARAELFQNELTRFVPTYDGRKKEPVTLPCKLPLLLMLGADGIAVGLSTRILPHNFIELIEAQVAILNKKPFELHPDFQQGGLMDVSDYDGGRGRIRLRAVIEKKDPHTLLIRQVPFGTDTASILASIEDAIRRNKIKARGIHDFTADRVELEIQLQPDEDADKAREALFAFTQCEVAISCNPVVIRDRRPVEMGVEEILRHNTKRLVELLRKDLQLQLRTLIEDLHRKTLVHLFVEHKIYKRIEDCDSSDGPHTAVAEGMSKFRPRLRRDITADDIEMLLGLPIKRISRFDLHKNQKDMDHTLMQIAEVEKNLGELVPYAIRYLKKLARTYADDFPRRTKIARFGEIEVRELTARELAIGYESEKGYLGFGVKGEILLECSSFDRILVVMRNGRYKVMPPPEKTFVDTRLAYGGIADRDRVMTVVYTVEGMTYIRRFTIGGFILNKEYSCAAEGAEILLFSDAQPEELYVRYAPRAKQLIRQQVFKTKKIPVRNPKTRGILMTTSPIHHITTVPGRDWDASLKSPAGVYMDFV